MLRPTTIIYVILSDRISNFLNSITLGELMAKQDIKTIATRQDGQQSSAAVDKINISFQL